MDRAVKQSLRELLPTWSDTLPAPLVDLAVTLLAHSRIKASSLKADEEIARSYACCNIACERLKSSLGLPKLVVRAPCAPRIYKKLFGYLDELLGNVQQASTPKGRKNFSAGDAAGTPSKASASRGRTTTSSRKELSRLRAVVDVPGWIMPCIRRICEIFHATAAPHHIFAGVSSIWAAELQIEQDGHEEAGKRLAQLMLVVYFLVTTRLAGVPTPASQYINQRDEAINLLNSMAAQNLGPAAIEGADVDTCMRQGQERQWTKMDWFMNIPLAQGLDRDDANEATEDIIGNTTSASYDLQSLVARKREFVGQILPGIGTMISQENDWRSPENRLRYQEWKAEMMMKIRDPQRVRQPAIMT